MFNNKRPSGRRTAKNLMGIGLSVVLSASLVSCSGASASSDGSGGEGGAQAASTINYVGVVALPMPEAAAQTQGFFEAQGVDVTEKELTAGTNAMSAMVGGSTDFAAGGDTRLVQSAAQGLPVVAVALQQTGYPSYLVVPHDDAATEGFEDLVGKKIGIEIGSSQYAGIVRYLEAVGLSPDDYEWVNLAKTAAVAAVESKSVDAAVFTALYAKGTEVEGIGRIVTTPQEFSAESGARWPFMLVTSQKMIDERPDDVQKFVNAYTCAKRFLVDNPEEARDLLQEQLPEYDPEIIDTMINDTSWEDGKIGDDLVADIREQAEALVSTGSLDAVPDLDGYIDNSFVEKALTITCDAPAS